MQKYPTFKCNGKQLLSIKLSELSSKIKTYQFHSILDRDESPLPSSLPEDSFLIKIPLKNLFAKLTKNGLKEVMVNTGISVQFHNATKDSIASQLLLRLKSAKFENYLVRFDKAVCNTRAKKVPLINVKGAMLETIDGMTTETYNPQASIEDQHEVPFPPDPPSVKLKHQIITGYCDDLKNVNIAEVGCRICGELFLEKEGTHYEELEDGLDFLGDYSSGCTRQERKNAKEPVQEIEGPVVDRNCCLVCPSCFKYLKNKKLPPKALANGLWLGEVPEQLKGLTWAEKTLVARVRVNRFIIKVSKGQYKMRANVVAYQHPTPKLYKSLPPPLSDIDEVMCILFVGPCDPTTEDMKNTPGLVRRNKVKEALDWLKLNHIDYADLVIDYKALEEYPLEDVPVLLTRFRTSSTQTAEGTSIDNMEVEEGATEGPCPFVVHGLVGNELGARPQAVLAAIALNHLNQEGTMLAVGHKAVPESIFKNPLLYPQIFPWLFPYGLGGLENLNISRNLSSRAHKKHLLLYHDKRFQTDRYFPILSFNHEQVKDSTKAGYILTKQSKFERIKQRIMSMKPDILENLIARFEKGEHVQADTEDERNLFAILNDVDSISGQVDGSWASKKLM